MSYVWHKISIVLIDFNVLLVRVQSNVNKYNVDKPFVGSSMHVTKQVATRVVEAANQSSSQSIQIQRSIVGWVPILQPLIFQPLGFKFQSLAFQFKLLFQFQPLNFQSTLVFQLN